MDQQISINLITNNQEASANERADAAANRLRILTTAQQLFSQRGVAAVHMADIAELAGVGKGTIYRRFANKGELCLALMDNQLRLFQNNQLEQMRQMSADGVSKLVQLEHFLEALVYFTEEQLPLLCEVQKNEVQLDNSAAPYYWLHLTVSGLLRSAVQLGELPAQTDIPLLADLLLSTSEAQNFRFLRQRQGFSVERIIAGMQFLVRRLNS